MANDRDDDIGIGAVLAGIAGLAGLVGTGRTCRDWRSSL